MTTFVLLAGAIAAAPGCLDFTPITSVPASVIDSGTVVMDAGKPVDGASDAGAEAAPQDPCLACLMPQSGTGCASEYAACQAVDRCGAVFACGVADNCFAAGADLFGCVAPCGVQAGIVSENDPAVAPLTALYLCVTAHCQTKCSKP